MVAAALRSRRRRRRVALRHRWWTARWRWCAGCTRWLRQKARALLVGVDKCASLRRERGYEKADGKTIRFFFVCRQTIEWNIKGGSYCTPRQFEWIPEEPRDASVPVDRGFERFLRCNACARWREL